MYRLFWGKAQPDGPDCVHMHPLAAHSLDVAAVAVNLTSSCPFDLPFNTIAFLVALHDIGKFSRPFQGKAISHWPVDALGRFPAAKPPPLGPRHDAVGLCLLEDPLSNCFDLVLPPRAPGRPGWSHSDRRHVFNALAGHHGRPPFVSDFELSSEVVDDRCLLAARSFVADIAELFQPAVFVRPAKTKDVVRFSWHLAGLTTVADWIGSRQSWFPYAAAIEVIDLEVYWHDHALPRAKQAVREAGLAPLRPAAYSGMRGLFPTISVPSPVQAWAESVPLADGPVLAVIEDLTGSGKTEAAVTLAHRLIADGRAQGIFLALPTMATANAMFGRLATSYRGLFDATTNPSLVLAHGRANLDPRFVAAIAADPSQNASPSPTDPADEAAEAHCTAWLAEDRRRALLAQVGVGTLDQALLAALPVRHSPLRLWGLAGKVLIIDEAHAFDAYMQREMIALLRFHAALGGSAILLSATLPRAVRQGLADAFRDGLGQAPAILSESRYPLTTLVAGTGASETACLVRDGLARRVTVTRLADAEVAIDRIAAAATTGAAIAWVRNTVDDAIAAAGALRARGIEVLLFHARFAMSDRLDIEREVLRRFGRDDAGADRKGVLVATQVIEQSLDLDFDLLCTDLAPADLLIQRAGRLWRHKRDLRPVATPELLVVSPEPVAEPDATWLRAAMPGTDAVYRDTALVWRSARAVFGRGGIVTPDDMRPLIETTFDSQSEGSIPVGLAAAAAKAAGKVMGQQGIADQNVLNVWGGYRASVGLWDTDLRTPTRLEDQPQVTLRLAVLHEGIVVPYAHDPDLRRAWSLSEVRVAQHRMSTCPAPAGLDTAVAAARAQWGRWERESDMVLCAVLQSDGDGWFVEGSDPQGSLVRRRYDPRTGLHN